MTSQRESPIVHDQHFIVATRDTGYRSTASAVAELVDNSIQAGARRIRIFVDQEGVGVNRKIRLAVLDDGSGMDGKTLREAVQFGGSSRFDDRVGPGRFGMGLPNSSISQAKRLEVYSWRSPSYVIFTYLDVDQIADGQLVHVPRPVRKRLPDWVAKFVRRRSGTLVVWNRCDRLDNKKAVTVAAKLHRPLGRRFRHFIWKGLRIWINGERIAPIDPLFLQADNGSSQAIPYGDPLTFEVRVADPHRWQVIDEQLHPHDRVSWRLGSFQRGLKTESVHSGHRTLQPRVCKLDVLFMNRGNARNLHARRHLPRSCSGPVHLLGHVAQSNDSPLDADA